MSKARKLGLKADDLILDQRLQVRADGTDEEHIEHMLETLQQRRRIEEPVQVTAVWYDGSEKPVYYVTDGFHTVKAHKRAGRPIVRCAVREGTWTDAVINAATANQTKYHKAKKLTNADKRRAVQMILTEKPRMSAGAVAELVKVSRPFAQAIKEKLKLAGGPVEGRDGKTYETAGVQSDAGVRDIPIDETSVELPDPIHAAIRSFELATLGEVYDHLAKGGTMDLKPRQIAELKDKLVKAGVGPAPIPVKKRKTAEPLPSANGAAVPGAAVGWQAAAHHFEEDYGRLVRSHDQLAKVFTVKPGGLHSKLAKLLEEMGHLWEEWKTRSVTKSEETTNGTSQSDQHRPEEGQAGEPEAVGAAGPGPGPGAGEERPGSPEG